MTKLDNLCEDLSNGIRLYALFMSAIKKTGPFACAGIVFIGSIGQLHFVSSIIVLKWRAPNTILIDSSFFL